jgi:hypothetical protein
LFLRCASFLLLTILATLSTSQSARAANNNEAAQIKTLTARLDALEAARK